MLLHLLDEVRLLLVGELANSQLEAGLAQLALRLPGVLPERVDVAGRHGPGHDEAVGNRQNGLGFRCGRDRHWSPFR